MPSDMTVLSPVVNPLPEPQPELPKKSAKHAAIAMRKSASKLNTTLLAFIVSSPFVVGYPCLVSYISIPTSRVIAWLSSAKPSPKGVAISFLRIINHIPRHVS